MATGTMAASLRDLKSFNQDKELAKEFLANFVDSDGAAKYLSILQDVANRKVRAVYIDLDDLAKNYQDFSTRVSENPRHYIQIFASAIDDLMPEAKWPDEDYAGIFMEDSDKMPEAKCPDIEDSAGTFMEVSDKMPEANEMWPDEDSAGEGEELFDKMPEKYNRFCEVYLIASSEGRPFTIRAVRPSHIGQLVRISGVVTGCTDVLPLLQDSVYSCDKCGFESYPDSASRELIDIPLFECPSRSCRYGYLNIQLRPSRFSKLQEAKVEEVAENVPKGQIPRTMIVQFKGELTRKVSPGDAVELSGIFHPLPVLDAESKAMRAGLASGTYLEAMSVMSISHDFTDGDKKEQMQPMTFQMEKMKRNRCSRRGLLESSDCTGPFWGLETAGE